MQQLIVERKLQQQVSYNSSSLLVFNCLMLGQKKNEIIEECMLNEKNYPKYERPIYNCILDLFELKASNAKDNILTEVHYAIYEQSYESNTAKVKALENLFHQMKRYGIEQESAPLLKEMRDLSIGSPLYAVYHHLYNKYTDIAECNEEIFKSFAVLNTKLYAFIDDDNSEISTKDLVKEYKTIRTLHHSAENKTSETVLNFAMLLLATYAGQKQLLLDNKIELKDLFTLCRSQINDLPFGIERFYLNNIFHQTTKYAIDVLELSLESEAVLFPIDNLNTDAPNFSFAIKKLSTDSTATRNHINISEFVQKFTAFSIPQDSFSIRPNQI